MGSWSTTHTQTPEGRSIWLHLIGLARYFVFPSLVSHAHLESGLSRTRSSHPRQPSSRPTRAAAISAVFAVSPSEPPVTSSSCSPRGPRDRPLPISRPRSSQRYLPVSPHRAACHPRRRRLPPWLPRTAVARGRSLWRGDSVPVSSTLPACSLSPPVILNLVSHAPACLYKQTGIRVFNLTNQHPSA
jgi:hypothetical protein